jgi:hypothetical protein
MTDQIQFRTVGEWTVVYVNGKLERAGDSYLADEWLQARYGVEVVDDEDGVCLPDGRTPLPTLAEVEAAEADIAARRARAAELRAQADALAAEADQLTMRGTR